MDPVHPDILVVGLWYLGVLLVALGVTYVVARMARRRRDRALPPAPELPDISVFGIPLPRVYDPAVDRYVSPPICVGCGRTLAPGDPYLEIPLPKAGPNASYAVCAPCDSKAPYDRL